MNSSLVRSVTAVIVIAACAVSVSAAAETLTFSFNSSNIVESSTAIVNTTLGKIHPRLQADAWDDGSGTQQKRVYSVGDGRHGSFDESTRLQFHDGAYGNDQVIRINTDLYPDLQFTSFVLDEGWTILPVGSRPLVIRSLGKITVRGTINCSGENGVDLNADKTVSPQGGVGHCGGASGGAGGFGDTTAVDGEEGDAGSVNPPSGGLGGVTDGHGGGGGGGFVGAGAPGKEPIVDNPTGPSGGVNLGSDPALKIESGGAGGGGGARYANPAPAETAFHSSGAGGGAGGGTIALYAADGVIVSSTGVVSAQGGNGGGGPSAGKKGGAGGGGGGGSILVFTLGEVIFDGDVSAAGGHGGVSNGGDGGDGGDGRTWVIDTDGIPGGGNLAAPYPGTTVIPEGVIDYEIGSYTLVSSSIDLENTRAELVSASFDATAPSGSSVTLQLASGDSPFSSSDAQWVDASALASASGKRYLRFRLVMDSQSSASAVEVRSVSIQYNQTNQNRFEFTSCALMKDGGTPPEVSMIARWAACLMLLGPLILVLGIRLGIRLKAYAEEQSDFELKESS